MLSFKFEIDEDKIARTMIRHCERMSRIGRYITEDQVNFLWALDRTSYNALKSSTFASVNQEILNVVKKMDFFPQVVADSKMNKERIEKKWARYQDKVNEYLKSVLRIDFTLENTKAYIVSPNICNGNTNISEKYVVYGHTGGLKDEVYDIVYLTHEALHVLLGNQDMVHAIIEKIADEGLNELLNGEYKRYRFGDLNGLLDMHVRIFPYWNLYLNKSTKEIDKACKTFNISYNKKRFEPLRPILSKMNIYEFISWLNENNIFKMNYIAKIKILNNDGAYLWESLKK